MPLLVVQTVGDGLTVPSTHGSLRELVRRAGRSSQLGELYVRGAGHCTFNLAEQAAALRALEARLDRGSWALQPQAVLRAIEGERFDAAARFITHRPLPLTRTCDAVGPARANRRRSRRRPRRHRCCRVRDDAFNPSGRPAGSGLVRYDNTMRGEAMTTTRVPGVRTAVFGMLVSSLTLAATPDALAQDDDNRLQEVVVTAERRAVSVQDVPISAVALSGDVLEARGVRTLADLQFQVPSLTFSDNGNSKYVNIRGVGISESAPNQTVGVAVHLDGAYVAREFVFGDAFFDLDNVEVLRGPQGTYSGQNASWRRDLHQLAPAGDR